MSETQSTAALLPLPDPARLQRAETGGAMPDGKAFDAFGRWVAALHGQGAFDAALLGLARFFEADAAVVMRWRVPERRQRAIAAADCGDSVAVARRTDFARDLLGEGLPALDPGQPWHLSEVGRRHPRAQWSWTIDRLQDSGVRDVAVVLLEARAGVVDWVEFQLARAMPAAARDRLTHMAPALSEAWQQRRSGAVQQIIARRSERKSGRDNEDADLLDIGNPAGLSRSEYRVCVLVREGLLARNIAHELSIRESTVRSHLRAIYAKTGCSGHVELLHRLTRDNRNPGRAARDPGDAGIRPRPAVPAAPVRAV